MTHGTVKTLITDLYVGFENEDTFFAIMTDAGMMDRTEEEHILPEAVSSSVMHTVHSAGEIADDVVVGFKNEDSFFDVLVGAGQMAATTARDQIAFGKRIEAIVNAFKIVRPAALGGNTGAFAH